MDSPENTSHNATEQGAPRVFQRCDGGWAVVHDEDGVTWLGKLTVVPDRTALRSF